MTQTNSVSKQPSSVNTTKSSTPVPSSVAREEPILGEIKGWEPSKGSLFFRMS